MSKKYVLYRMINLAIPFSAGVFGALYFNSNRIPNDEHVQESFIAPRELEVICRDTDGDGNPETLMDIRGKRYMLKDVDGKPTLLLCEI
jgi:hypothetical protein